MAKRTVKCPQCGASYQIDATKLGKKGRCSKCGNSFTLGVSDPEPADPSAPQVIDQHPSEVPTEAEPTRRCPFCAEVIRASAQKCRYCGEWMQSQRPVPAYTTYNRSRSTYPPNPHLSRNRQPTWVLPTAIVGALCLGAFVAWQMGLLSRAGIAVEVTDIRKVIANPEAYAGRTLKSRAIIDAPAVYSAPGASNAMPLFLMADRDLEDKAIKILRSVGEYQSVMIKYRIHDRNTFAKIRAREQAGADPQRHAEAEENDPRNYQGVLLDIWIR